jgi:hypothetical protein
MQPLVMAAAVAVLVLLVVTQHLIRVTALELLVLVALVFRQALQVHRFLVVVVVAVVVGLLVLLGR